MENIYCKNLNLNFVLDTTPLEKIKAENQNLEKVKMFYLHKEEIDPNFINFLKLNSLEVRHAELFYTPPGGKQTIHIDHDIICNSTKINFVYGGDGSTMQWWEPKDLTEELEYKLTSIGTKYIHFERDKCNMVWRSPVGKGTLLNVGRPHSVYNSSNEGRWCMSYLLTDLVTTRALQWKDAVQRLKSYLD
jgi:hypothetical protein